MKIVEFIGILVVQCQGCNERFVVDSQAVKEGFQIQCPCGQAAGNWINNGSQLDITIRSNPYGSGAGLGRNNNAMPLAEYKARLAEKFLGKLPKVSAKHKNVVSFEESSVDVATIASTLEALGYSKKEIMEKIDVAVKDGFFHEDEIIKYILSLK